MSRLVKSVKWQEKGSRSQLRWCGEGWERAQIRKDLPAVRSWSCKFNCSCCSHHTLEYFTQELANTIRLSFLFHHDLTAPLIPQTSYCFFLYKNHFCFLLCSSQNSFFSTVPWCSLLPFFSSSLNFCLSVCWPLRFNNAVGQVHAHTAPLQHTRKHQYIHTHTDTAHIKISLKASGRFGGGGCLWLVWCTHPQTGQMYKTQTVVQKAASLFEEVSFVPRASCECKGCISKPT